MADQELKEHQFRALEAYKYLEKVLAQNEIRYFAIAGTALGAVRHKGFIPWDDDIDIAMTMDQFNAFIKIAPNVIKTPYTWKHTTVDENYETLSGRISYGKDEPLITVFPLVKLSDNKLQRKMQWVIRKIMYPIWQRKVGFKVKKEYLAEGKYRRFATNVAAILALFFSKEKVLEILRNNEIKYQNEETEWYCNIYSKYTMEKESIKAEWVSDVIRVPFEDTVVPVVKDYEEYLTHLYGDYMTPPPEIDRHPVHL